MREPGGGGWGAAGATITPMSRRAAGPVPPAADPAARAQRSQREWPARAAWIASPQPIPTIEAVTASVSPQREVRIAWLIADSDTSGCEALGWSAAHTEPAHRYPANFTALIDDAARHEGHSVWIERRASGILAMGALLARHDPALAERLGLRAALGERRWRTPPTTAPVLCEIRGTAPPKRKRAVIDIGPQRVSVRGRSDGDGHARCWVLIGDARAVREVARNAGMEWNDTLRAWWTRDLVIAAALAAFADPSARDDLIASGVPLNLHAWLRHAPALVPWQRRQWVLIGAQTWQSGYRQPPQGGWRRRGAHPGWGTDSGHAAFAMRRYAPRPLRTAFERANEENILSHVGPGKLKLLNPERDRNTGFTITPEDDGPQVRVCARCERIGVLPAAAPRLREASEACEHGGHCPLAKGMAGTPIIRVAATLTDLIRLKPRASRTAWRRISYAQALETIRRNQAEHGIEVSDEDLHRWTPPGAKLRPCQRKAVRFALERTVALDGTIMAGGKTITALTVLRAGLEHDHRALALAIVPAFLRENWMEKASWWLPSDIRVTVVRSARDPLPASGLIIMSYEAAMRHRALHGVQFKEIVCDEAHRIKNPDRQRSRTILSLRSARWLFLTGTPIYNRPKDIYPVLRQAAPDAYADRRRFDKAHAIKDPKQCTGGEEQMLEELGRALRETVMFRPPPSEVLAGLPPKLPPVLLPIHIGKDTAAIAAEEQRLLDALKAAGGRAVEIFAQISALRQHVGKLKIDGVVEQVALMHEEAIPTLVFTCFKEASRLITEKLNARGIDAALCNGDMAMKERLAVRRAFQEQAHHDVVVLTMDAGGEGLDMQRAQAVVFAEIDWSPSKHDQCQARAYREGQLAKLQTFYAIAAGTAIDHHLAATASGKESMHATALGDTGPEEILLRMSTSTAQHASATPTTEDRHP